MQRSLLVIPACIVLSAAASLIVVTTLGPAAAGPDAVEASRSPNTGSVATAEDLQAIRRRLDDLAMELALLREERESASRVQAGEPDDLSGFPAGFPTGGASRDALRDQVAEVLSEIEKEKVAEDLEKELEDRREEAIKSYKEYDEFEDKLDARVAVLRNKLGLPAITAHELAGLLTLQNDRNREVTSLWSQGATSEEELAEIFMANRAAHRSEVMALLGDEQLGAYRKYVQASGLGGRFSFFTAPWEEWTEDGGN